MIELNDLPEGWITVKIENVTESNPKHDKNLEDELEISFIPMSAVDEVTGTIKDYAIKPLGEIRKGYAHFANGDVIFAKITPCMENGKCAVANNLTNGIACGSTEFQVLRSNGIVLAEYLHRYLRQESYRKYAAQNMTGVVGQRRVPRQFLLDTEIPLPPLNEQRRIVSAIEQLTDRSNKARTALADIPKLIEQFRQSVLAAAFRGDLTADWRDRNPDIEPASELLERIKIDRLREAKSPKQIEKINEIYSYQESEDTKALPTHWQYTSLEKLASSLDYGTSAKSSSSGDVVVLRMGNLQGGEIDWGDLAYTSDKDEIEKYNLQPNTVLFNRTNSPELVGKTSIYRGDLPAIFAGYIIRINNVEELDPEYLNYCLNSDYARNYCWKVKTDGVSQSNINAQKLGKFEIPFCSLKEQKEVIGQIKRSFKIVEKIEKLYQENYSDLEQLDRSILAKAFRGELVPQDPSDEPAAVLLERIRAERETSTPKQRGKTTRKNGSKQLSINLE